MSQELERVYTIPLGKVLLSQSQHRAVRAINMIREFARKHMKTQEIKIDEEVAHLIWSKGVRSPPRKIRVRMTKTDDGFILVSKYEGESESEEKDTKKSPEIKQEPELQIEDPDAIEVTEETLKEETAEIEKPKADKPKEEKPKAKESKPKADKPKEEKPKAKESKPKAKFFLLESFLMGHISQSVSLLQLHLTTQRLCCLMMTCQLLSYSHQIFLLVYWKLN